MSMKEYIESQLDLLNRVIDRGDTLQENITRRTANVAREKIPSAVLDSISTDSKVQTRRYSLKETSEMANVAHTSIYTAENDGRLPKPITRKDTKNKIRAGYTINEVNNIRKVFNTKPSVPGRAPILGFLNLKGGSTKTTCTQNFAHYAAIQGYKVLIIDTDPQGSLSLLFGKAPDREVFYEHTIAPFILEDHECLEELGLPKGSADNLDYAIQGTYWDNIDIIPACMDNLNIDLLLPKAMFQDDLPLYEGIVRLRQGLENLSDRYDFIVIDGTPSINISTLNVISACDVVWIPTPCLFPDYASTLSFLKTMRGALMTFLHQEPYPNIPEWRYFITKESKTDSSIFMSKIIKATFNENGYEVANNTSILSDEIVKASNMMKSIFEINPSESDNRKRLKDHVDKFEALFQEIIDTTIDICFGEEANEDDMDIMIKSLTESEEV